MTKLNRSPSQQTTLHCYLEKYKTELFPISNLAWELDYICCRGPDPVGDKSGRGFSRSPLGDFGIIILLQGLLESLKLSAIGRGRQSFVRSAARGGGVFSGQGKGSETVSGGKLFFFGRSREEFGRFFLVRFSRRSGMWFRRVSGCFL